MPLVFPKKTIAPKQYDPWFTVIFSHPGKGKTTALSLLPNNLILDMQHGAPEIGGLYIDTSSYKKLLNIKKELAAQNLMYDFITLDTATELEEFSETLALKLYQDTSMGKNWGKPNPKTGKIPADQNNIKKLPQGGGYGYIREAFQKIIKGFEPYVRYGIILLGHMKDKLINDTTKSLDAAKLDLTGKLGRIICSKANAVGYIFRDENKTMITFDSEDLIIKTRCQHLRNKNVTLIEYDPDTKTFTHHWDLIYPNYFKQLKEK